MRSTVYTQVFIANLFINVYENQCVAINLNQRKKPTTYVLNIPKMFDFSFKLCAQIGEIKKMHFKQFKAKKQITCTKRNNFPHTVLSRDVPETATTQYDS